jgi:predicted DNA-binding protein (MmcQ/YjbR family)
MDIEQFREYCLSKKGTTECFPFDETTLVFKVAGKMYALSSLDGEPSVNLKCDPEKAIELRDRYSAVLPAYHMSKVHWNTVLLNGSIPEKYIKEWIDESYNLVVSKLTKAEKSLLLKS